MASAKSASLWAIVGNIGTRGLSFVFFLLIARVLTPAHLGVLSLALAFGLFLDAVIEFGLVDQVVRHQDGDAQRFFSTVFWSHVALSVVGMLVMMAVSPWVAQWYQEPELRVAMVGVAVASAFQGVSLVPSALLTRRFEQKALAKRNAAAALAGGGIGLALAYGGYGVRALVALQVVNSLTGLLMVWISAKWTPLMHWRLLDLQPVLRLARHSLGARLLDTVVNRLDQLMIGSIFGASALGLYALAIRLYDVLFQAICLPIAGVMLPYLAPMAQDKIGFKKRYLLVLETTSLVVPPLFIVGALCLPDLLPVLFGAKWMPAAPYIHIILGVGAVQAMAFTHTPAFAALGKPWANLLTSSVATVAWLFALLALPGKGAIYAALLWAGRAALGTSVQVGLMRYLADMRLPDYWRATKATWLSASALFVSLWVLRSSDVIPSGPWWNGVTSGVLAGLMFGAAAIANSDHIRQFLLSKRKGD